MDVITIDSSDEEEAAADTDGKERIMVTSTLRRTLSTQSDDDNSSISSDDIWKTIGLSSRPKKDDSGADNDALLGNFKGRCIISPSEGGKGLQKATQFEHSSVHTVCNVLCVTAPSRKSKETPIIPPSDSDDSSISSADSIWDKAGLPPRSKGDGAAAPRTYFPLDSDNDSKISANQCVDSLPPEVPLPVGGTWRIVLLMDHREFGCANNFLSTVEKKINNGGNHAEITTLPSADYLFVARLISDSTGEVMDERVLDMVIERKNVQDACQCLIADSKSEYLFSHFIVSFCCDSCNFLSQFTPPQ
jgi:hypothetical protein